MNIYAKTVMNCQFQSYLLICDSNWAIQVVCWYGIKALKRLVTEKWVKPILNMPEYLEGINNRMFDLMHVFSKQHYVHHGFNAVVQLKLFCQ
jgi:hypothetical protein